jgi:hypothetical protein
LFVDRHRAVTIGGKVGQGSPCTREGQVQNIVFGCAVLLIFAIDTIVPLPIGWF